MGFLSTSWVSDAFHHIANVLSRCRGKLHHNPRHDEIEQHTYKPYPFRGNAKQPVVRNIGFRGQKFKIDDITTGKNYPGDHTCYGSFFVHTLAKNPHDNDRKK